MQLFVKIIFLCHFYIVKYIERQFLFQNRSKEDKLIKLKYSFVNFDDNIFSF